jgi:UDP-glucose 4-epimerase
VKNVLITGSSGFIGTNLINKIKHDYNIFGIDLKKKNLDKLQKFYNIDLKCLNKVSKVFYQNKIDVVIHLAADPGFVSNYKNPINALKDNLLTSLIILENAKKHDVKKVFLFSSMGVDNFRQNPTMYAFTKLSLKFLSEYYVKTLKVPSILIKLSNVYGPYSIHKNSVIHSFFKKIYDREKIIIHDKGIQTRDFLFVDDISKQLKFLIDRKKIKNNYNFCSGKNTSINNVYKIIKKITNKKNKISFLPSPLGYDELRKNKIKKNNLYFKPTSITDGLILTNNWYSKFYKEK